MKKIKKSNFELFKVSYTQDFLVYASSIDEVGSDYIMDLSEEEKRKSFIGIDIKREKFNIEDWLVQSHSTDFPTIIHCCHSVNDIKHIEENWNN
nr:hypothetical protein [uncultured Mediterranean phage uvMED]